MADLKIVLDSNEYIFFFTDESRDMLKLLNLEVKIYLNELIFREVIRNIRKESAKLFINLLRSPKFVVNMDKLSNDLIRKYKDFGLKKGDIEIGAFCDSIRVSFLISENRHFLKEIKFDEFRVVDLSEFLKQASSSSPPQQ